MKTVKIINQADWDALPPQFEEYTVLELPGRELIVIENLPKNSHAVLWGNSHAQVFSKRATITASHHSLVVLEGVNIPLEKTSGVTVVERTPFQSLDRQTAI